MIVAKFASHTNGILDTVQRREFSFDSDGLLAAAKWLQQEFFDPDATLLCVAELTAGSIQIGPQTPFAFFEIRDDTAKACFDWLQKTLNATPANK